MKSDSAKEPTKELRIDSETKIYRNTNHRSKPVDSQEELTSTLFHQSIILLVISSLNPIENPTIPEMNHAFYLPASSSCNRHQALRTSKFCSLKVFHMQQNEKNN
jgi:hypothetical protein